jgi:hypothetical protein
MMFQDVGLICGGGVSDDVTCDNQADARHGCLLELHLHLLVGTWTLYTNYTYS